MGWSEEDIRRAQSIRKDSQDTRYSDLRDSALNAMRNGDKAAAAGYVQAFKDRVDRGEKDKPKPSSCFITTAVCDNFGKADDCYELTTFRNFRDNWLVSQPDGKFLIDEYYEIAPKIVNKINHLTNADEIYSSIWSKYLKPCLCFIESGKNEDCKTLYVNMVKNLREKFLR